MDIVLEKTTKDVKAEQNRPDPLLNVPKIFCADHDIAKALLVDLFALIGSLRGMEENKVDKKMIPQVLINSQKILSNFGDLLIRDCELTDDDLKDVMQVFENSGGQPPK